MCRGYAALASLIVNNEDPKEESEEDAVVLPKDSAADSEVYFSSNTEVPAEFFDTGL